MLKLTPPDTELIEISYFKQTRIKIQTDFKAKEAI